jgi:hypothetical protein
MKLKLAYYYPFYLYLANLLTPSKKEERTIIEITNEWNIANKSLK